MFYPPWDWRSAAGGSTHEAYDAAAKTFPGNLAREGYAGPKYPSVRIHGNYTGPGNPLPDGEPVDGIDHAAMLHDMAYQAFGGSSTLLRDADDTFVTSVRQFSEDTAKQAWREKNFTKLTLAGKAAIIAGGIRAKTWIEDTAALFGGVPVSRPPPPSVKRGFIREDRVRTGTGTEVVG